MKNNAETMSELMSGLNFGKEAIRQCKERGEAVPEFVYERTIEIAEKLIALQQTLMSNQIVNEHGVTLTLHPVTKEVLRGYIFQEEGGTRWEIVADQTRLDPEKLLRESEVAHNYFEGERPIASLRKLHFVYEAYATPRGGIAYLRRFGKA